MFTIVFFQLLAVLLLKYSGVYTCYSQMWRMSVCLYYFEPVSDIKLMQDRKQQGLIISHIRH